MGLKTRINAKPKKASSLHKVGRLKRSAFKQRRHTTPLPVEQVEAAPGLTLAALRDRDGEQVFIREGRMGKNKSVKPAKPLSKVKVKRLKTRAKHERAALVKKGLIDAEMLVESSESEVEMMVESTIKSDEFIISASGTILGHAG
jgi:hypothetical protein